MSREQAGGRLEGEWVGRCPALPQHVGRGQRPMAAEGELRGRGEPSEPKQAVARRREEGRRRLMKLGADALHPCLSGEPVEQADGRRVPRERPFREGVDEVQRDRHGIILP